MSCCNNTCFINKELKFCSFSISNVFWPVKKHLNTSKYELLVTQFCILFSSFKAFCAVYKVGTSRRVNSLQLTETVPPFCSYQLLMKVEFVELNTGAFAA